MEIYGPGANSTSTRKGNLCLSEPCQKRAQDEDRSAHCLYQFIRDTAWKDFRCIHDYIMDIFLFYPDPKNPQKIKCGGYILKTGQV